MHENGLCNDSKVSKMPLCGNGWKGSFAAKIPSQKAKGYLMGDNMIPRDSS